MVRAVRGAIKIAANTEGAVTEAVTKLMGELLSRNSIGQSDIISLVFSQTADITSKNPATALRTIGFAEVPLFCTQEPDYLGSEPAMLRVLCTYNTELNESIPVYLGGAERLRKDISS